MMKSFNTLMAFVGHLFSIDCGDAIQMLSEMISLALSVD